jgi:hypothetical protein
MKPGMYLMHTTDSRTIWFEAFYEDELEHLRASLDAGHTLAHPNPVTPAEVLALLEAQNALKMIADSYREPSEWPDDIMSEAGSNFDDAFDMGYDRGVVAGRNAAAKIAADALAALDAARKEAE